MKTEDHTYTSRLLKKSLWKDLLDVQRPYRNHLQSLNLGNVLEIGCGIGRNLINLGKRNGDVGVDHNISSVQECRSRGLTAFTSAEFFESKHAIKESFDTILVAHVFEHLTEAESSNLLRSYISYLKPNGTIMIITPQEAGFRSDPTHLTMMNPPLVKKILTEFCGDSITQYSFPLPMIFGHIFKYNENVALGRKYDAA
jgi:2-polyprenyl-3-methyl-5-hydroxy-6-metoxy-1,4-benzoquinol methylase